MIIGGIVVVLMVGAWIWKAAWPDERPSSSTTTNNDVVDRTSNRNTEVDLSEADRAGLELSNRRCVGTAKPKLTHLPMRPQDFAYILPYGLMIGGHVTPIDHQYFSPTNFNSKPGTYEVYAMADSTIVDIGTRTHPGHGPNANLTVTDYRIVFAISCRLLYYYDLVTDLAPDIAAALTRDGRGIDLSVKAGQLIGRIGGQTLDFAVWDTERPLTGFVAPDHYGAEIWKRYTADPLEYETDEVRTASLAKYLRTAEPVSGKIDYDVDGRLIGNWFQQGTNGYNGIVGEGNGEYWVGHLAFAPDYLDPTGSVISIGNYPGGASQFATISTAPKFSEVGQQTGVVKYDLRQVNYFAGKQHWDRMTLTRPLTMAAGTTSSGCFLVEMTGPRKLRAQVFKGSTCTSVSDFTSAAVVYER